MRNWTVLFIFGASGTGKSSAAYELARFYGVNVMEVDDVHQAVKTVTTRTLYPAIHYWERGINWMDIGVDSNVNWLIDVSKEMTPALKAIADRHLEDDLPVIMEGDFICPDLAFDTPKVKMLHIHEPDKNQILQNFLSREGGELQQYRVDISIAYGDWLLGKCTEMGIPVIESRPWDTLLDRAIERISIA